LIEDHKERRLPAADGLETRTGDDLVGDDGPFPTGSLWPGGESGGASGGDVLTGSPWEPAAGGEGDELHRQQDNEQPEQQLGEEAAGEAAGTGAGLDAGDTSHAAIVSARARATWLAAAVLAVVVAVLAVVIVANGQSTKERQTEVKGTARRFALALSTYDYRHLDLDLGKVRAMGVGNFPYQYHQILGGNSFESALKSNEVVATATIKSGPFVAALGKDDARTFTVLEQTITGKSAPKGETRKVRVESILVRTPAGWRIDWVGIT
jgi:Mce-associated membrane protein